MEELILNDGTRIPGHAIRTDDILWIYIDRMEIGVAFNYLYDSRKTSRIQCRTEGTEGTDVYIGFTKLFTVTEENDGSLNAGLKKAV